MDFVSVRLGLLTRRKLQTRRNNSVHRHDVLFLFSRVIFHSLLQTLLYVRSTNRKRVQGIS